MSETLAGLRAWCASFRAYYQLSQLETMDIAVQQTALFNVLDKDVAAKLLVTMTEDTPIYGDDGAIAML